MSYLLEVENITMQFGGLKAVDQLNLHIPKDSLTGLIGPNGAGKTTAFNVMTGVYHPTAGKVLYKGQNIVGLKPFEISRLGITRTFQNIRLFKNLTVLDNLLIASIQHIKYNLFDEIFLTKKLREQEKASLSKCMDVLEFFNLAHKANDEASSLPYGEQRKLEIARAISTEPELIFLDEPAAGMNPSETANLMELISLIRKKYSVTILLIEHDMKLVMGICEKIYVLDHGVKIAEGTTKEIQNSKAVIEAYLGPGDL
ncbi:MAG: ABC transporter ATP-binding protein [Pseudobdellovibrionaceae bacterium]